MEIIDVTKENIDKEHICCAISSDKDIQVSSKKAWLKERFEDGLVFKKGNVRGKCFIEYIPAEKAWAPIEADGYMYIDCLWVSGQFKGQGNSNLLLEACIEDSKAKGKKGLVTLSSDKKRSFLSDPQYLKYKGFIVADTVSPFFTLMYLPFGTDTVAPKFKDCVKNPKVDDEGYVLYYANQCPFTAKYVPVVEEAAKSLGAIFKTIKISTTEQAQNAPTPFTSYTLFCDGKFVTNEIQSEKGIIKIITK